MEQIRYSAINDSDFLKFVNPVRGDHFNYPPLASKNEATLLPSSLICGQERERASRAAAHRDLLSCHHMNVTDTLKIAQSHRSDDHDVQEVCPESIRPFEYLDNQWRGLHAT